MNNEEKNLLKVQLVLNYYKKDITDRYMRCIENIVLDNDVLNVLDERVYITTFDKYNQLQNNWNELMEDIPHILEIIEHNKDVIKVTSDEELAIYSLQNKMQELEQGKDE